MRPVARICLYTVREDPTGDFLVVKKCSDDLSRINSCSRAGSTEPLDGWFVYHIPVYRYQRNVAGCLHADKGQTMQCEQVGEKSLANTGSPTSRSLPPKHQNNNDRTHQNDRQRPWQSRNSPNRHLQNEGLLAHRELLYRTRVCFPPSDLNHHGRPSGQT